MVVLRAALKKIGLCVLGIALSLLLLSTFVSINRTLVEARIFEKEVYSEQVKKDSDETRYERLSMTLWRFDWIFHPSIVVLVSLFVAVFDRSKHRSALALISLTPLLLSNLFASSLSLKSFFLTTLYIAMSAAVSIVIPPRKVSKQ